MHHKQRCDECWGNFETCHISYDDIAKFARPVQLIIRIPKYDQNVLLSQNNFINFIYIYIYFFVFAKDH